MSTRKDLLHSSLRLLAEDQKSATATFTAWKLTDTVRRHESIGPLIGSSHRRLRRNLDRIYMLLQSYQDLGCAQDTVTMAIDIGSASSPMSADKPQRSSGCFELADIPHQAYRALETLRTRYSSVYFAASAVGEPPIVNVARSNREGICELMNAFDRVMPLDARQVGTDSRETAPGEPPVSSSKQGVSSSSPTPDSK